MFWRRVALLLAVALAACSWSQIVIKPVGGSAYKLTPKSLEARADVYGGFSAVRMTYVFRNPIPFRSEADFLYTLPVGATATGFSYWYGNEEVVARIVEKQRARQIYETIKLYRRDPALVEMVGKRTFRARIFPVEAKEDLKVQITWVGALPFDGHSPRLLLPLRPGKETLEAISVNVQVHDPPSSLTVGNNLGVTATRNEEGALISYSGQNTRPTKDLLVSLSAKSGSPFVYSAQSSGSAGAVAILTPGSTLASVSGAKLSEIFRSKVPGGQLLVARYGAGGPAVVRVGAKAYSIALSGKVVPQNPALKLWAAHKMEALDASPKHRSQAIKFSLTHTLLSKYTSWLAIPEEERKRFDWAIKRAAAVVLARQYVQAVNSGSPRAPRLLEQLKKEAKAIEENWQDLVSELAWEQREKLDTRVWDELDRKGGPRDGEFRKRVEALLAYNRKVGFRESKAELFRNYFGSGLNDYAAAWVRPKGVSGDELAKFRVLKRAAASLGLDADKELRTYQQSAAVGSAKDLLRAAADGKLSFDQVKAEGARIVGKLKEVGGDAGYIYNDVWLSRGVAPLVTAEKMGRKLASDEAHRVAAWREASSILGVKSIEDNVVDSYIVEGFREIMDRPYTKLEGEHITVFSADQLKAIEDKAKFMTPMSQELMKVRIYEAKMSRAAYLMSDYVERGGTLEGARSIFSKYMSEERLGVAPARRPAMPPKEYLLQVLEQTLSNRVWGYWSGEWDLGRSPQSSRETAEKVRAFAKAIGKKDDPIAANPYQDPRSQYLEELRKNQPDKDVLAARANKLREYYSHKSIKNYGDDVLRVIQKQVEIEKMLEDPVTEEERAAMVRLEEETKAIRARMGDPLLTVDLPRGVLTAKAVFPWGEELELAYNSETSRWQGRFDVPPTAKEGDNQVVIIAQGMTSFLSSQSKVVVDLTKPEIELKVEGAQVVAQDKSGDVARVKAFAGQSDPVDLILGNKSTWAGTLPSAGGAVKVVATDKAHNRIVIGGSSAAPRTFTTVPLKSSLRVLDGRNIQAMTVWKGRIVAAVLNGGVWIVEDHKEFRLAGMPSDAPKGFAQLGDDLVIRFGDGEIILVKPDLTTTNLTPNLPRKQAMAITAEGKTLVVAQPGMLSEWDGVTWTHTLMPADWKGAPVTMLSLTPDWMLVGLQGRGLVEVNRKTKETRVSDERHGLTDDWVTATAAHKQGDILGTFVGGSLLRSGGSWELLTEEGVHVTSLWVDEKGCAWIGTRAGLYGLSAEGTLSKMTPEGWNPEVQAVASLGGDILIGTREGIFVAPRP